MTSLPLVAEQPDRVFVVRSSRVVTDPEMTPAWGNRQGAKAVGTVGGYCVAWRDLRQGGMLMATRISPDGELLDPLGLPLSYVSPFPLGVLRTDDACVVLYHKGFAELSLTTFEPDDPSATPQTRFAPMQGTLVAQSAEEALFAEIEYNSRVTLRLMDGTGTVVAEGTIQGAPAYDPQLSVEMTEEHVFVARSSFDGETGLVELYSGTRELAFHPIATVPVDEAHHAIIGAAGGNLVLATWETDPPYSGPADHTVRIFSAAGELLSELSLDLPSTAKPQRITHDGLYEIEWRDGSSVIITKTDGTSVISIETFDPQFEKVIADAPSGRRLVVESTADGDLTYLVEGAGMDEPSLLTHAFPPEILIDAAFDGDQIAMLWEQLDPTTDTRQLFAAVTSRAGIDVSGALLVDEASGNAAIDWQAAIAMRDGEALVSWSNGESIRYRRIAENGLWRDEAPRELDDVSPIAGHAKLNRHSLVSFDDGFSLVWLDFMTDGHHQLYGATIREDEHHVSALTIEPFSDRPTDPSLVAVEGGFIVAWLEDWQECRICTCPMPPRAIRLGAYDQDWTFLRSLPSEGLGSYEPLSLTMGEQQLLLVGSTGYLISDASLDNLGEPKEILFADWNSRFTDGNAIWNGDEFLVTGYFEDHTISNKGTALLTIDRSGAVSYPTGSPVVVLDHYLRDWWSQHYSPVVFERNGRLVLLDSAVSSRPEEGTVRRIRETVLGETPSRRRAIRRR